MEKYKSFSVGDAADLIQNSGSALIVCHTNPDGDALGSALGLKKIFDLLGRQSKVVTPSEIPEYIEFLAPGVSFEYSDKDEDLFDTVITVDVASRSQLGALSHLTNKVSLMIDHHSSGEAFAPNLIKPDASAAGEIVFELYKELKQRDAILPCADVSRYLFAAISADTGSFKYSNTTPRTFLYASELSEEIGSAGDGGMCICDISRLLHDTVTEKDMKISAMVSKKIKLYENGALAVCGISPDDMTSIEAEEKDLGGAIDIVRTLKGVIAAVTLRQKIDGSNIYKISARANADLDVSAVCAMFGGGGHTRAAGATFCADSPEGAMEAVVSAFSEAVRKYNASHGECNR